jgi:hypothetical protein
VLAGGECTVRAHGSGVVTIYEHAEAMALDGEPTIETRE